MHIMNVTCKQVGLLKLLLPKTNFLRAGTVIKYSQELLEIPVS